MPKNPRNEPVSRSAIYEYMSKKRAPHPTIAWNLGEAMRHRGKVAWCCGLFTLFYSGNYRDFVGTIAAIEEPKRFAYLLQSALKTLASIDHAPIPTTATAWERSFRRTLEFQQPPYTRDSGSFEELTATLTEAWRKWYATRSLDYRFPELQITLASATAPLRNQAIVRRHISDQLSRWLVGLHIEIQD